MRIFSNILELVTCSGLAKKGGRHSQESDLQIIKNGAFFEDQGRILWIGQESEIEVALRNFESQEKEFVNLSAECVLPGFVDCHTHLLFAGDRRAEFELRNQGVTYQEIAKSGGGIQFTVKHTGEASKDELRKLAEERAFKFLKQGVTTVEVKSGYGLTEDAELKSLEVINKLDVIRVIPTYLGPHAIPRGRTGDEYIEEIVNSTLPKIKKLNLAKRVDMYIENGFFNLNQAEKYFLSARDLGLQFTAHLDQLSDSGACGQLVDWGVQSLDHLVYTNVVDQKLLARSNSTCVLLPTSDFYLKMRFPPARELLDSGARVALATDYNPGTAPSQDLSFLGVLARLEMRMTLPEVIGALTVGGAYALGLQSELGSLEVGKVCDFSVWDTSWRNLFYSVGEHPVRQVYRSGASAL